MFPARSVWECSTIPDCKRRGRPSGLALRWVCWGVQSDAGLPQDLASSGGKAGNRRSPLARQLSAPGLGDRENSQVLVLYVVLGQLTTVRPLVQTDSRSPFVQLLLCEGSPGIHDPQPFIRSHLLFKREAAATVGSWPSFFISNGGLTMMVPPPWEGMTRYTLHVCPVASQDCGVFHPGAECVPGQQEQPFLRHHALFPSHWKCFLWCVEERGCFLLLGPVGAMV